MFVGLAGSGKWWVRGRSRWCPFSGEDGAVITLGDTTIKVLEVPCHTKGHVIFHGSSLAPPCGVPINLTRSPLRRLHHQCSQAPAGPAEVRCSLATRVRCRGCRACACLPV